MFHDLGASFYCILECQDSNHFYLLNDRNAMKQFFVWFLDALFGGNNHMLAAFGVASNIMLKIC